MKENERERKKTKEEGKRKEREQKMTTAFQQMAGGTFAMSHELGPNDTMEVLAATVAYAVLINRSTDEKKDLDTFRQQVEVQLEYQRPQVKEMFRNLEEAGRKYGE